VDSLILLFADGFLEEKWIDCPCVGRVRNSSYARDLKKASHFGLVSGCELDHFDVRFILYIVSDLLCDHNFEIWLLKVVVFECLEESWASDNGFHFLRAAEQKVIDII